MVDVSLTKPEEIGVHTADCRDVSQCKWIFQVIFQKQNNVNITNFFVITAVQEERGPRKPKFRSLIFGPHLNFKIIDKECNFPMMINENSIDFETAANIFLTAIRSARRNPGFGMLNRQSQNIILGKLQVIINARLYK